MDHGALFSVRKVELPSREKATDFVEVVANATMVQVPDRKVAREIVAPFVRLAMTVVLMRANWRAVMACDLTWSNKRATIINSNQEKRVLMVPLLFWRGCETHPSNHKNINKETHPTPKQENASL